MRYRLGRSHLDLVYRQLGDAPSDEDVRVAVFSEVSVAIHVVQLLNGEVEEGAALESAYDRPPQCPAMSSTGQRCHANKGHQGTHVRFNEANGLLDYWDPAVPQPADEPVSVPPAPVLRAAVLGGESDGSIKVLGWSSKPQPADEPAPVPPPVDALPPLPPKWTRPSATEAHNIANVLAAPQHTVPAHDYWDERPFVAWQAAAIQQVMYRAIDDAWAAGVEEGHGLLDRAVVQEIEQRERAEEIADKLTAAIGRHLGVDFGEHSNANDPWGNALIALAEADGGKFVKAAHEDGVTEGRRQRDAEIAASVFASAREVAAEAGFGPVPDSVTVSYLTTDVRARVLTEAYWKLRELASALRSTFVYTNAQERAKEATEAERDGMAMRSDGRWREKAAGLRSYSRGVEAGARLLAELLGVEEHEIERPEVDHD